MFRCFHPAFNHFNPFGLQFLRSQAVKIPFLDALDNFLGTFPRTFDFLVQFLFTNVLYLENDNRGFFKFEN